MTKIIKTNTKVTCWPSVSDGLTNVSIEYELQTSTLSLKDVTLSIPYPYIINNTVLTT